MDILDRRIVTCLAANARISLKELALAVGLSSPTVAERVKRLEDKGAIRGYTIVPMLEQFGYQFQTIVRINPLPGALRRLESLIEEIPQIVECDRVTGEDCFHARLFCRSMGDLDQLLDPFHDLARTHTAVVKGQLVERRLPPLAEK